MQQTFDGIQALGEYIIVEQVGTESKLRGGIIAPETAASPVWKCISVGPQHQAGAKVGDRIGFRTATQLQNGGKNYAVVAPAELLFALPMPDELEAPEEKRLVQVVSGGVLQ